MPGLLSDNPLWYLWLKMQCILINSYQSSQFRLLISMNNKTTQQHRIQTHTTTMEAQVLPVVNNISIKTTFSSKTLGLTRTPIIARRPFLISFTRSSAKTSGSSARFRGSKGPPGYRLSRPSKMSESNLPTPAIFNRSKDVNEDMFVGCSPQLSHVPTQATISQFETDKNAMLCRTTWQGSTCITTHLTPHLERSQLARCHRP